jgi:hypothetical protein
LQSITKSSRSGGGKTATEREGETMVNTNLFRDLLRYGKIKADFEVKDTMGRYFRVRVFEYQEKKYFTVMCDGEVLRCEEV